MRFRRLGQPGSEIPVVLDGDRTFDLSPLTADLDGAFWVGDGIARARAAVAAGELDEIDPSSVAALRVGAPIARPGAVLCIGRNYAAHAAESGSAPPADPMLFFKLPNTVVGPEDDVVLPRGSTEVDWEVELGVVVGAPLHGAASAEEAMAAIAGYAVGDDLSERVWQKQRGGGQFGKGKNAPTFCPVGPDLVPADEIDPQALRIWSRVNGDPRQDGRTGDMIFPVGELLRDLSQYLVLEPGDLLLTGTPDGVAMSGKFPFLAAGDVLEVGIDGLGAQRNRVIAAR